MSRAQKEKLLPKLNPAESAGVLHSLLERHPELVAEAEQIAQATVTDVDAETVAEDVEETILGLDLDDLEARAGRKSWGYVEPTEAAWELLGEAGRIYNRPFLRCLHGYGLCLWRLGKLAEAEQVFERILALNPNDNQGVRFCWNDVRHERTWDEMRAREDAERAERRRGLN